RAAEQWPLELAVVELHAAETNVVDTHQLAPASASKLVAPLSCSLPSDSSVHMPSKLCTTVSKPPSWLPKLGLPGVKLSSAQREDCRNAGIGYSCTVRASMLMRCVQRSSGPRRCRGLRTPLPPGPRPSRAGAGVFS